MIGLLIFEIASVVAAGMLLLNYIFSIMKKSGKENIVKFFEMFFSKSLRMIIQYVAIGIAAIALFFGSISPYVDQQKDYALIDEYNANIKLYQEYSDEYASAARQQIAEYQKMQSEMARTASVAQLQFWSQQQDVVGNQLTDSIKKFQDLIMQQKLAINAAQAPINRRPHNKWYFGINK